MAKQLNVNLAVTANTQQAKQQLQQLQQTLSSLTTNSANLKIGLDQTQLQQASKQLLELQAHLKAATNVDTGALDFTKLNNSIRNSGKTLTQYGQQLLALGPQGKEAFAQLAQSVAQSEVPIRRLSGLLGQFGTVLKNTIRWQISSSLIHGFMGSIQQAYGYAQDLNKSLNNIQIVTGLSDNQMAKFAKTANTAAKALSTTTTKYTDAALIYYQQGIRNEKEITERTNATIKMANVTGQSAEAVSNQMTAIWNNFADGSKNLEYYADVITALGAATASSSEEISQGLQKFAAVADTVGLSYENATAALATITATTRQSADTVGTGLRTLFSRLQGLSLGQTLEDGVNLTKYSKALATVGVNALDAQGQLRNMDDILNDLGNKWQSLSKAQQVALAQTVGGVRQYTNLIALMDNFDFYQQNVDIAKNSEGTLQKQQAIYEKSWEASAKRVKAAAETIYSSLINDQFFIKLNDGFAGFLDILNNIIAGLGGMKGLLLGIGGVMTNVFSGQIAQGMYNFGMGIRNLAQTPSRQRNERAAFINNAAGLMAGGTYDAKTNTVTNVPNNNGPFSLVGQYTAMLQHQAAFSGNAQYMTAQQKQMAQMALDNETKAYQDYQQKRAVQQRNLLIQQDKLGALKGQLGYSDLVTRDQGRFNTAKSNFDYATGLFNQRVNAIKQIQESGTLDGLDDKQLGALYAVGITPEKMKTWKPDELEVELQHAQERAAERFGESREAFRITMSKLGAGKDEVEGYIIGQQNLSGSNFDVSNSQRRAEQARKNAEETAGLSSKGLRAATGITNLAAGLMSGMAVSTQWDQMKQAMEQFKAGTLSTKDAVTQVTSSIAGMGINGAMVFSSMTKAVQAFGVASTTAAGWIGAILTAITILAPKAIALFDKMHTTDAEIGEQLTAGVEQATTSANEAKQAYDNLINGFNTHSSLLDTLNDLTEGTLEFKKALLEANDEATKLIREYNIDASQWKYNDKGIIEFTEGAQAAIVEKYYKKQLQAKAEENTASLINGLFERDQAINNVVQEWADYTTTEQKNWKDKASKWYGKNQSAEGAFLSQVQDEYAHVQHPDVYDVNGVGYANHIVDSIGYWWDRYQKEEEQAYNNIHPYFKSDAFEDIQNLYTFALSQPSLRQNPRAYLEDLNKSGYFSKYIGIGEYDLFEDFDTMLKEFANFVEGSYEGNVSALRESEKYIPQEASISEILAFVEQNQDLMADFVDYVGEGTVDFATIKHVAQVWSAFPTTIEDVQSAFEAGKAEFTKNSPILRDENGNIVIDEKTGLPQFAIENVDWEKVLEDKGISAKDIGFDDVETLINALKEEQAHPTLTETNEKKYNLTTSEGIAKFLLDQSQIRNANVSNNKLALSSARMAMTGQTLSATENFITDILSEQTTQIADIKERSKILTNKETGETLDLTQQNVSEKDIAGILPAVVKEIQKTEGYKAAEDKNEYVRNAVFQKQFTGALQKVFDDAYQEAFYDENTKLPTLNKALLDNWQNLTLTEFATTLGNVFNDEAAVASLVKQYAKPITDEFLVSAKKAGFDISEETFLENVANKASLSDWATASALPDQFTTLYGEKTGQLIAQKIYEPLLEGNTTMLKVFEQFQSTGSKITDLANIKAGKTSLGTSELASDVYDSILSEAGEKGLFEELYNSEDFAEGLKSLRKELKKTGKIGADSLVALADQSELLSNYLEVSGTNVQGLADALNLLETGQIDNISNALLRALSAAGAVNSNLAQTYAYIDNFKEERSVEDIGAFMKKRADTVKQGFTSGMLLDAPLLQSMEALFGSDMRAAYQQDIYKLTDDTNRTPEQISKEINEKYADQIAAMQSIQERGNLSGMYEYYEKQLGKDWTINEGGVLSDSNGRKRKDAEGKDLYSMFSYNKNTGQVVVDTDSEAFKTRGWASQDKYIQDLMTTYGMSESMARGMAAEYAATNGKLAQVWRQDAAEKGVTALTATVDENGNKLNNEILTGDQARAFYKQYKDVIDQMYGYDSKTGEESFLEKIAKDAEATGKEFIDLGKDFDIATASFEELQTRFDKSKGKEGSFKEYLGLPEKGGVVNNLDSVKQKLVDLGMTSAKANTEIDKLIDNGEIKLFDNKTTEGAQTEKEFADFRALHQEIKSTTEAWEAFQQAKKEQAESDEVAAKQQELITNAIKDAAQALTESGIDVKLNPIDEAITTWLNNSNYSATVQLYGKKTGPGWDGVTTTDASGYNNAGFAGGKHSNGQYEGLAEVGELGPELFIHDGQPYLAGIHGRTKAYVHPNDQIYTAAQTQKILRDNPSLQDIPAFSVGYNQVSWGGSSNANANNAKTSKWEPERYHLITRQIKDLQREYERLSKIKDNAYGTNKLEAIQKEIDATNQLIEGQKRLVQEAEDYLKIDTDRVTKLLKPGEFQLDENGNLANFEELQQKYRKAAEEDKDKKAEEIWKALMQYEETLDKLHEADEQMRELIYQQMELRLETITTKVDLKINFDEKEIKLIDHYIGKIDDNIYDTAQVLVKTGDKLAYISRKIDDTKEGLAGLFEELSDSEGNLIRKEDGSAYTMEEWLALSEAERDALNINGKFGEQLEEYMDNILEYIEELEEFKTKGVEEFGEAFEQLNSNVRESIDLFDHYNSLMETLKNIVSLQGAKISPELQTLIKNIDALMFQNTQNNLQAEQQNYERLKSNVEDLKQKIANTTDETLKRAWEEQLKTAENEMRTSQQNLYQLWETGLQQAKDRFDTSLDEAVQNYERKLSGIYGTIDDLQKAWNRKKRNTEFYEPDFEKYYQINRLQRTINNDLANQLKNGFKQSEGLKKLYKDLNDARADGVQLTAYDLDMYQKRYEYEKALMDLEDSRNAKTQVRLQRDASGNWGYVYTSNIDEDELLKKEQAVEDAFYQRQKTAQERLSSLSDDIMSEIGDIATTIQEMQSRGADEAAIQDYLKDIQGWLNNYKQGLATALHDADITEEEARQRYGAEGFDIIGTFSETLLSAIMGDIGDLDTFFTTIQSAMDGANEEMQGAATEYQQAIIDMNHWFEAQGENFISAMTGFATAIAGESNTTLQHLIGEEGIINDAKNTFSDILKAAEEFEKKFLEIYQPIIDANEQLVADLLKALDALNRNQYQTDNHSNQTQNTTSAASYDTGGYTGAWGASGKFAILHEKEQIFNANDTAKILNAAQILRTIDLQADLLSRGLGALTLPTLSNSTNQELNQNVQITAEFPNATNHSEIEEAFTNLINKASQYANRKGI